MTIDPIALARQLINCPSVTPARGEVFDVLAAALEPLGFTCHRWVLGEIWSRKELSRRDRSIVVIGIFTSLGATNELGAHLEAALANGLAPVEIEEIVNHLSLYVGGPRAHDAMRVVRHGLKTMDKGA